MKKVFPVLVLLLLVAPPLGAQSQMPPYKVGADVGYFAPFESGWDGGFSARVNADLYYWDPLGLRLAFGVANPTHGDEPFRSHADTVYLTAGLIRAFRQGRYHPYLVGGVGYYHFSTPRSISELGLNFGGGVEMPLGRKRFTLAPELMAHIVAGDGPRFSLTALIGVRYLLD